MKIHPTAIIEEGARIADDVSIGPFCHVGANATLDEGVILKNGVVISGMTTIGARTVVHAYSVLGGPPQHVLYKDEVSRLTIGADNVIREHSTMNSGTPVAGGETKIGDNGFFMVGAHVAHDCHVGDNVIFANNATLGGHVRVGDNAFLGGLCAVHQHARVGAYSFVGGCAAVTGDIIPYGSVYGNHARLGGLNIIGMKRRQMPRDVIHKIRGAYRELFQSSGTFAERLDDVRNRYSEVEEVMRIVGFIDDGAARSLITPVR